MSGIKGKEEIHVGKGTCIISWSKMGKEKLICALETLMDLIEYGDKSRAMPRFAEPDFERRFQSITKEFKKPAKKAARRCIRSYKERRGSRQSLFYR